MSTLNSSTKEPLPPLESARLSLLRKAHAVRQFPSGCGRNAHAVRQFPSGCGRNVVSAIKKDQEAIQEHTAGSEKDGKDEFLKVTNLPNILASPSSKVDGLLVKQASKLSTSLGSNQSLPNTQLGTSQKLINKDAKLGLAKTKPVPKKLKKQVNISMEKGEHKIENLPTRQGEDERPEHKIENLPTRQGEDERPVKKNDELTKSKFVCSNLSSSFDEDARSISDKCQPRHQVKDKGATIQTIDPPAVVLNDGCQPKAETIIPNFPDEKILEEAKENLLNSSAQDPSPSSAAVEGPHCSSIIEIDSTRAEEEDKEESQFQEDVKFSLEELDVKVMVVDSSSEEVKVQEAQFQNVTYLEADSSNEEVKVQEAQFQALKVDAEAESCPLPKEAEEAIRVIMEKHKAIVVSSSEPESQWTIEKTRRKRKKENNFEIVPLKRGKHDFLVHNSDLEIVPPIDSEPRQKVMETLYAFRSIYDMILQQDSPMQTNQLAYKLFRERNGGHNGIERFMGTVPGVEIGDEFRLRVEMFIIGLHCQHQAGIDYIKDHGKVIAVSIVSSGRYSNNRSNSDVLLYSGSGVVQEDQKLERGNLALKNSVDSQIPVRVIHGIHKYQGNKRSKMYVYDGLYLAEKYWFRKGEEGHCVIMFRLRRIPGQPEIGIRWSSARGFSAHHATDISNGEEDMPIHAVNTVDGDLPMHFKYVSKIIPPPSYTPAPPTGCGCTDGCSDKQRCACAVKNGGKIWFNDGGEIMKARPLVYECGPCCKCPPSCRNRVSQHGINIQLEIFKTQSTGWGVRSRTLISSGSFVCEYAGEVLPDEEAQKRANDEYLFVIGNNYREMGRGRARPIPSLRDGDLPEASFAVDASEFGNVGRFVNHSCSPNLYAQNVLYDHDDIRMPHIMLFASEDIQPFTELTYDYNYNVDQVYDCNGNVKKKKCHCGSQECTGLLY